jgi:hypothetical protein
MNAQRKAETSLLRKLKGGRTIIVHTGFWLWNGNTTFGTRTGRSTKVLLDNDELRAAKRLGKQGVLVERSRTKDAIIIAAAPKAAQA